MKKYLVIKDNYVIATIRWDGISEYTYPDPIVELIEDVPEYTGAEYPESVGVGAWYERDEKKFMNYIGPIWNDAPPELDTLKIKNEE